jgi:probable F420-dependent oxidoreductase
VRTFQFAVTVRSADNAEAWRAKARRIEALGYTTLNSPDHLTYQFAPIPAYVSAADATTRLRVGALVFANDYRNPVLFAKEIATLDVLSGGRCDVGLGTGWYQKDYDMLGIALDSPADRVGRLAEAVRLIKRLWDEESVDHDGRFYRTQGAMVLPRPVQRPHPPILIGGNGPSMLRLAGRHADIFSITRPIGRPEADTSWHALNSRAAFESRLDIVRVAAGDRFDSLSINADVEIRITEDPEEAYAGIAEKAAVTAAEVEDSPHYLIGSLPSLRRQLLERRERYGLCYYSAAETDMETLSPLAKMMLELDASSPWPRGGRPSLSH